MQGDLTVIYNDECPICSREVSAYRRSAERHGAPLAFEPLTTGAPERAGLAPDEAARRLHVVRDGEVLSGLDAFRALWAALPGLGWLARLTGLPVVRPLAALIYDRAAAPLLHAMHRRRVARRSGSMRGA